MLRSHRLLPDSRFVLAQSSITRCLQTTAETPAAAAEADVLRRLADIRAPPKGYVRGFNHLYSFHAAPSPSLPTTTNTTTPTAPHPSTTTLPPPPLDGGLWLTCYCCMNLNGWLPNSLADHAGHEFAVMMNRIRELLMAAT